MASFFSPSIKLGRKKKVVAPADVVVVVMLSLSKDFNHFVEDRASKDSSPVQSMPTVELPVVERDKANESVSRQMTNPRKYIFFRADSDVKVLLPRAYSRFSFNAIILYCIYTVKSF